MSAVNDMLKLQPHLLRHILVAMTIAATPAARNIRVVDSTLTVELHVKRVCRTCYFFLRDVTKIMHYLTDDCTKTIIIGFP